MPIIIITRIDIASNSGCHPSPIATKRQPFENNFTVNADQRIAIYLSVNFQYILSIFQKFHISSVSMATAAILKIPKLKVSSIHTTLYVGFPGFYDGLMCFPLNEAPIYVGKHMLMLAKAFMMKMTPCIDQ